MGIIYEVVYHEEVVVEDIPPIATSWKREIRRAIETKLTNAPEVFGVHLRNTLKGYRKLRVGDYRVIFRIESKMVKIFAIGHRANIYSTANKRI
ncbi:MAG: Toxin-antitoxin system, toxin component, RelE family [Parcubacteria group bacterium GW2011_GWA1_47_8]|nr:MAG: Toxin-antitoxin system, toxin component, RelE family [Parcubacteria group bacterium GW2011_GWA1_47_8]KKW07649.1 MAG: Toxin-antitoxin system, toxin component, RelE family [Parcubacteria group bacterium GW2011_GWA2_49_16]